MKSFLISKQEQPIRTLTDNELELVSGGDPKTGDIYTTPGGTTGTWEITADTRGLHTDD